MTSKNSLNTSGVAVDSNVICLALTATWLILGFGGCHGGDDGECQANCPSPTQSLGADSRCDGLTSEQFVVEDGRVVGFCRDVGSCVAFCSAEQACPCGMASGHHGGGITCRSCEQRCGDGACDGTERESCDGSDAFCELCAEDCSPHCGNGLCDFGETASSCEADCTGVCTPGEAVCLFSVLRRCSADGVTARDEDCAAQGLTCRDGACVPGKLCPDSGPVCVGSFIVGCTSDGLRPRSVTDCAGVSPELTCVNGQCAGQGGAAGAGGSGGSSNGSTGIVWTGEGVGAPDLVTWCDECCDCEPTLDPESIPAAYGWSCAGTGIDLDGVCRAQYGPSSVVGCSNVDDANCWFCSIP